MELVLRSTEFPGRVVHKALSLVSRWAHHPAAANEQTTTVRPQDLTAGTYFPEQLINWERGKLSPSETLAFFQELVDSGMAWKSTGAVQRTAAMLLRDGRIQRKLSPSPYRNELASPLRGDEEAGAGCCR